MVTPLTQPGMWATFSLHAQGDQGWFSLRHRYGIKADAYQEYFTRLTGQWDNVYVASEDERDGGSLTMATVVATAVMMAPLVLVGVKVGSRLLRH